jgi:hypothetical protein
MVGRPASRLAVRCVVSRSGRAICENLQLSSPTAITGATSVTARLPPQRSKSMRGRHDNHRRFEVPAANGSRPIVRGRLRGDKVSELFRTGDISGWTGVFTKLEYLILNHPNQLNWQRHYDYMSKTNFLARVGANRPQASLNSSSPDSVRHLNTLRVWRVCILLAVTWTHRRAEPSAADFPALSSWILGWAKRNGDKGCWML